MFYSYHKTISLISQAVSLIFHNNCFQLFFNESPSQYVWPEPRIQRCDWKRLEMFQKSNKKTVLHSNLRSFYPKDRSSKIVMMLAKKLKKYTREGVGREKNLISRRKKISWILSLVIIIALVFILQLVRKTRRKYRKTSKIKRCAYIFENIKRLWKNSKVKGFTFFLLYKLRLQYKITQNWIHSQHLCHQIRSNIYVIRYTPTFMASSSSLPILSPYSFCKEWVKGYTFTMPINIFKMTWILFLLNFHAWSNVLCS